MKPEYLPQIEGRHARLRPITESDAEFLFQLRNNRELTAFVNDGPATIADQMAWLKRYFSKSDDHNFIVHSGMLDRPVGTVALYDIRKDEKVAEPGRWLVLGDPLAAIEADLLINAYSFDRLGLDRLVFSVFALNAKVLGYHLRSGAYKTKFVPGLFTKRGVRYDGYWMELDRETFVAKKRPMLERILYRERPSGGAEMPPPS